MCRVQVESLLVNVKTLSNSLEASGSPGSLCLVLRTRHLRLLSRRTRDFVLVPQQRVASRLSAVVHEEELRNQSSRDKKA